MEEGGSLLFDDIILEPEQEELFMELVEIERSVPRKKRRKFMVSRTHDGDSIIHPGVKKKIDFYFGDVEILADRGLLYMTPIGKGSLAFDITPEGFCYYEYLKEKKGEPVQRVEEHTTQYLDKDVFKEKYPKAYEKWREAESLLWKSNSEKQLSIIGHLCREAVQEFIDEMFKAKKTLPTAPKSKIKNRLKELIDSLQGEMGEAEENFLIALAKYWSCVSDLIQRQEHEASKEGKELVWEDGRRIVFHTAILIYEIDRSI